MENLILPSPNSETKFFWQGCKEHRLLFQRCNDCGFVRWPPNIICPECLYNEYEIIESKGMGIIFTYAIYHYAYHEAFKDKISYNVAVVKLDEGPMVLTNIVDCNNEELLCGVNVTVIYRNITSDFVFPFFKILKD